MVELGSLLERAERKRVQDLLKEEQQKVEKELGLKKHQKEQQVTSEAEPCAPPKAPCTVKITNYGGARSSLPAWLLCAQQLFTPVFYSAWDQSERFVKIYLTLKDVHENAPEQVQVEFREG